METSKVQYQQDEEKGDIISKGKGSKSKSESKSTGSFTYFDGVIIQPAQLGSALPCGHLWRVCLPPSVGAVSRAASEMSHPAWCSLGSD